MLTYGEREMRRAELADQARARASAGQDGRLGRSGRHKRQVSLAAVMNAVNTEGREVLGPEAEGYWRDQERRYPWIRRGVDAGGSPRALRNRFGRVKERIVYK